MTRLDEDPNLDLPEPTLSEETYVEEPYETIEEAEQDLGPFWDASTLQKLADCPRSFELGVIEGLTPGQKPRAWAAGSAIHKALDYYYSIKGRDENTQQEAKAIVRATCRTDPSFEHPPDKEHLTEEHLVACLDNYFEHWNNHIDIYEPLTYVTPADLDLSDVLAARFRLNEAGNVILGESSIVMRFPDIGDGLILAGKPDLPVENQQGDVCIMDHKTSSGYLSSWWAQKHEVSNKLRGYMAMIWKLLGVQPRRGIINGIYVGKYATSESSNATKTQRFPFDFSADHIREALRNQYEWIQAIEYYRDRDYWPQGCAFGGCKYPEVCKADPDTRDMPKRQEYVEGRKKFFEID